MVSNKIIPKNLTSRFKTKKVTHESMKIKKRRQKHAKEAAVKLEQIFSLSDIPYLPAPSSALRGLLFEFNSLNDSPYPDESNVRRCNKTIRNHRSHRFKNINGFIAFRSFYSRFISNPDHQRQLSILLGKLWLTEPNKAIWNRYAMEYNAKVCNGDNENQPFVEWLCNTLNLVIEDTKQPNTSVVKNNTWEFSSKNDDNIVEDVYFIW